MIIMGATQPGLPVPVAIPKTWHLVVIDLKDCFFTIPLHPKDSPRFALQPVRLQFPKVYLIHDMDDIYLAAQTEKVLEALRAL